MVCPECGGGNAPQADRCASCGADLSAWRRPPSLFTARRAPREARGRGVSLVLGTAMILPLALAGYVEATSDLRLEPVPLLLAVLLAAGGCEVILRATLPYPRRTRRARPRPARRVADWESLRPGSS